MSSSNTTPKGRERNQQRPDPDPAPPDRTDNKGSPVDTDTETEGESDSEVEPDTESDSDGESLISDASTFAEERPSKNVSLVDGEKDRVESPQPSTRRQGARQDGPNVRSSEGKVRSRERERENNNISNKNRNNKEKPARESENDIRSRSRSRSRSKEKEKNELSHSDYRERAYQIHGSYNRLPSGNCCGCGRGCFHLIVRGWKTIWNKRFWRILVRWSPYILSIGIIGCAGVIGGSGPILGYYVLQLDTDREYGVWGWCQSHDSDCTSPQPLYTGPAISYFPTWFMPLSLAAMGGLAILHLLVLLYIFLFLRFPIQGYCGCNDLPNDPDLESQSQSSRPRKDENSKWSIRSRKIRSLHLFDLTLSIFTFLYALIAAGTVWWVSVAKANTLWPYDLNIVLLVSPIIWLVIRAIYRSRWAYSTTNTSASPDKGKKRKDESTHSQRSFAYDAYKPKEVIPSTAGQRRPKRNFQSFD